MRIAALASMVVLGPGAPRGCSGSSDEPIEVRWTLPEGPGDRGVRLVGCVDWEIEALPDGQPGLLATPGWVGCGLVGWRRDGQLLIQSEPVPLDGDAHQDVAFDLMAGPIGGMGAAVEAIGYGVLVHEVVTGSPADAAGIAPGDVIVEAEGASTRAMTTHTFVRLATGTPGTPLSVRIRHEGEEYTVGMFRERIP